MDTTRHDARIHELDRALAPGSETVLLGDAIRAVRDASDPDAELAWWVGAYARYRWLAERHARDGEEWSVEDEIYAGDDWTGWTPPPPTPDELRAWRESEGLTQERAAKLAGVERLAWARWETGARPVPQWLRDTLATRWGSAP